MEEYLVRLGSIVQALSPILTFIQPIAIASIFLYFIRSFFD